MQVSVISEPTTHAVVGGEVVGSFGIADSNEGFRIMSDTLYPDKPKAIVREYLCNAGDAHIAAGRPEKAIQVTLDQTHFKIRDFGDGIPDDQIIGVFCTLFASTKRDKAAETGGFGLGSKAGFSYRDHFQVTNHHAGTKTIYMMHIGGKSTGGKPVCQRLLNVPTDETGIEISIELKTPEDGEKFKANVLRIVKEGGMNVLLNGERVRTIDYAPIDAVGFGLIEDHYANKHVFIRLGQVRYPLEYHREIEHELAKARDMIPRNYSLVLVLRPGSVRPVPSRESLSYEEDTIKELNKALRRFSNGVEIEARRAARQLAELRVKNDNPLSGAHGRIVFDEEFPVKKLGAVVCDFESIGRIRASNEGSRANLNRSAWLRVHHQHKKTWRRGEAHLDARAFIIPKVLRAARVIGAENEVRIRTGQYNALESLSKVRVPTDRRHYYDHDKNPPRRRDNFFDNAKSITLFLADGVNGTGDYGSGFYLVRKGLTDVEREKVAAAAKKLGINVTQIAKPVPVKRVKKPKVAESVAPTVYKKAVFTHSTYHRSDVAFDTFRISEELVEKPGSFLVIEEVRRDHRPAYGISQKLADTINGLHRLFPTVVVATKQDVVKALTSQGVPEFFDLWIGELEASLRRPSAHTKRIINAALASRPGGAQRLSERLHEFSLAGAMAVVGSFKPISAEDERVYQLWRYAGEFASGHRKQKTLVFERANAAHEQVKVLLARFKTLSESNPFDAAFKTPPAHVEPLDKIYGENNSPPRINEKIFQHLLPMLEFHYRKTQKQKEAA